MIKYLRAAEAGKYYKVRALTATVSMNQNDYSGVDQYYDESKLQRSATTLTFRPLNINHEHTRRLPFPANRVDWAEYEDNAVECIIRIDNEQKDIQNKIDSGEIVNPSIEALPRGGGIVDGKRVPDMWNFTELALLEKNETLPGVPSTFGIEPLFINEGMARGLVESVKWSKEKQEMKEMSETENKIEFTEHDEATPEQIKEYWGIDGMTTCGQCKFFEMTAPVTTKSPAVTGADSDSFNTATTGAGFNVGICRILSEIQNKDAWVKSSDTVCQEGRPRDTPITVNRSTQNASHHEEIEDKPGIHKY